MNVRKSAFELQPGDVFRLPDAEALHRRLHEFDCFLHEKHSSPPEWFACLVREKIALVIDRGEGYDYYYDGRLLLFFLDPETEAVTVEHGCGETQLILRNGVRQAIDWGQCENWVSISESRDPEEYVEVELIGKMECAWRWVAKAT